MSKAMELTAFDIHHLVGEMQVLVRGKVDKVFQEDDLFQLSMHVPGVGKRMLTISLPSMMYMDTEKLNFPETPPYFCMQLRKRLAGKRLEEVRQLGYERVVSLSFGEHALIVELFSKGNIILLDAQGMIISAMRSQHWSQRIIKKRQEYKAPEGVRDVFSMGEEQFREVMESSKKDSVVKALAIDLHLGGYYAEEAMGRAKLDKGLARISGQGQKLYEAVLSITSAKPSPGIYELPDGTKKAFPIRMHTLQGQKRDSFNAAVKELALTVLTTHAVEEKRSGIKKRIDRNEQVIRSQQETIAQLEESIRENTARAEAIYEEYQAVADLIREIREAKSRLGWEEVKKRLKGHKTVKAVNPKENKVSVELKKR